jgi:cytidylate kinase
MRKVTGLSQRDLLNDVAERQMRNWALDLQTRQQLAEEQAQTNVPQWIHPYVAISREAGVDATELAGAIANECGWKVLDRELLDYLAEHDNLSRLALEFVDERTVSWFHEMFGKWLEQQLVSQAEYVSRLGRLVLLAAQHESSIFVGRGVQFMLPRDRGLAVRIIAPLKQRVQCLMRRKQTTEREAKQLMAEIDDNRAQFVQRYFHRDIADPHLYDLVVNLEHIPRSAAVELIASEAKRHAECVRERASGRSSADRQLRRLDETPKPA